jgi:hypothetical protein
VVNSNAKTLCNAGTASVLGNMTCKFSKKRRTQRSSYVYTYLISQHCAVPVTFMPLHADTNIDTSSDRSEAVLSDALDAQCAGTFSHDTHTRLPLHNTAVTLSQFHNRQCMRSWY